MRSVLEIELQGLKEHLLAMGALAETMIRVSIQALVDRNADLAREVFRYEEEMDQRCIDLDDRSFKLLALRQPVASDLRFIAAGIKINSELERIGDLAVNIALRTLTLLQEPPIQPLVDIPKMARLAQEMVKRSLDAFVSQNPDLARGVIEADDAIDRLRDQVFRELLSFMMKDPGAISRAVEMIFISRNLERIADHATNIAEDVIYIVRGEDVRERGDKEIRKGLRKREEVPSTLVVSHESDPLTRAKEEEAEMLSLFQTAAANVLRGAQILKEMFEHYTDPERDWSRIEGCERQGDELTHQIMRKLNRAFIPVIDRTDLHTLTSRLDDILDGIEAAASRMVLYKIQQPIQAAKELVAFIVAAAEQVVKAIGHLPALKEVEAICVEINRLENAADEVYRQAIAALFEGERHSLDVIRWKEIYDILEMVTDRCEDVADVVEAIALKRR
jgi:phosphate transport system protein